jgi:formate dehydrogenase subunit gamma
MKAAPLNTLPPHPLDDHARAQIDLALARYQSQPGPLLQVLHAVQASLGYVPPAAVPLIAQALNLSRAEVHGVITFYHHFRSAPPGRHTIQLCQAEACRSMHCEVLTEHAKRTLGIDFHGTTADGRFTLEPVYCLGNCACGPAMMVDGDLHGRVTPESFDALLAEQALPQ